MIKSIPYIFLVILTLGFLTSCEDAVTVELDDPAELLVIDAWINDLPSTQTISLRRSRAYFEKQRLDPVIGGKVFVAIDSARVIEFKDEDNDGDYTYDASQNGKIGDVGSTYSLFIEFEDKKYGAQTIMKRVAAIDSIKTYYKDEELGADSGYYAELFARDIVGTGDAAWIKVFKNGKFASRPDNIYLVYDAGFTAGAGLDGLPYITPIRNSINNTERGESAAPYEAGDNLRVEIHSLSQEAFYYLTLARTQMTLGDATLFAEPPANLPTNIVDINTLKPAEVLGFFNVASVSAEDKVVK